MRAMRHTRRKAKGATRMRHLRKPRRCFDPFESGDDDEDIVEIAGGPIEDKPVGG